MPRVWFQDNIFYKREPELLGERGNARSGAKKFKRSLEHVTTAESKGRRSVGHVKGQRSPLKQGSTCHSGSMLASIRILTARDLNIPQRSKFMSLSRY